ncbi:flagellar hook-associated protein FlgK [bacterium]|nr:flagellar hook-associated protein FlgK [bacterium]
MVSLFNALNISSNALTVNESAISVVSHNVANMNTEGYSKQKVNLATRNIAGAIGDSTEAQVRANGGVMIANIMRYNNSYLNNYYRDQLSVLKGYEAELEGLGDLADVFNDLEGTGITAALENFYKAINNLNEYPASSTARVNFIESAKTLTANLNSKSAQLKELTSKALGDGESRELLETSKIYNAYSVFNDKLEELAEVNKALQITQTGTLQANNLLDQRDMILNDIAQSVDINIEENPQNGSVTLYIGGQEIVKGAEVVGELSIQTAKEFCQSQNPPISYPDEWVTAEGKPREAAVISIVSRSNDGTITPIVADANSIIRGGSLGGLLHSTDTDIDGMNPGKAMDALNSVAVTIANLFNKLNTDEDAYCINPNDTTKLMKTNPDNYIFGNLVPKLDPNTNQQVIDPVTGDPVYELEKITAANISVNSNLLTDKGIWNIACAHFDNPNNLDPPPTFNENAIGNAQNVVLMLGTRNAKVAELGNMSVEDFYTGLLGKVAASGSNMDTLVETQTSVVDSIHNKILSNNSVDINEELVDLVKYQTAYSAAAKVFTTCNSCLDTLMALGG